MSAEFYSRPLKQVENADFYRKTLPPPPCLKRKNYVYQIALEFSFVGIVTSSASILILIHSNAFYSWNAVFGTRLRGAASEGRLPLILRVLCLGWASS